MGVCLSVSIAAELISLSSWQRDDWSGKRGI